jgi:hypothetical protein
MDKTMQLKESYLGIRGHIKATWIRNKRADKKPAYDGKNIFTFNGADVLAKLMGGDTNFIPNQIGYIYGPEAGSMTNPSATRQHTWDSIAADVAALGGNMILSPISSCPSFRVDGDVTRYNHNVVTLNAISDPSANLVFSGGTYATQPPQNPDDRFFQVVLISAVKKLGSTTPTYVPIARAQLDAGTSGLLVQQQSDLAVFWDLIFR